MGASWNTFGTLLTCFLLLFFVTEILQGLSLLQFQAIVDYDHHNALAKWDLGGTDPWMWTGGYCENGEVPNLVLYINHFFGAMPKDLGGIAKPELLDLRGNILSEVVPSEIDGKVSLKSLLISDNKHEGQIPLELKRPRLLYDIQFDENTISSVSFGISCINRKFGDCIWPSKLRKLNMADSTFVPIREILIRYLTSLPLPLFKVRKDSLNGCTDSCLNVDVSSLSEPLVIRNLVTSVRRRLLSETTNNIPPTPQPSTASQLFSGLINILPTSQSSGGFSVYQNIRRHTAENTSGTSLWERYGKYCIIFIVLGLLLIIGAIAVIMCGRCRMTAVGPWKTGLSGQLQKAFVTGVPNLKFSDIETSCEGFSNIVYESRNGYIIYKGTLSDGLEIAVVSIGIQSRKDWSDIAEKDFREKIETLSRVNHKNFVNLIGYCEENKPFTRMMVYEYASNGTLFEHLHVKGFDHLDWSARMRIIMGTAYCLEYLHHDVNSPVSVWQLNSLTVCLTEDFAAKVADVIMSPEFQCECMMMVDIEEDSKSKFESEMSGQERSKPYSKLSSRAEESFELQPSAGIETNVYKFGVLLLEVISGKLQYTQEQGSLVDWAAHYLTERKSLSYMVDPALKAHKDDELQVICEVVKDIIEAYPTQRPTMKEIVPKLRQGLSISPDQAIPRLSPLWWAELEILTMEVA